MRNVGLEEVHPLDLGARPLCRRLKGRALGVSNFLEEISSLSHSIVFLYFFALITEEGFLISPCYYLVLEWVARPSSGGPSQPRDQTQVSQIAGGFFTI